MPAFIVERYWPQVSTSDVEALADRLRVAVTAVPGVRYLGSMLLVEDRVVQCRFDAVDVAEVVAINDAAAAPYDRILQVRAYPA